MSDINELIATNAKIAFFQGTARERDRIIKLIEEMDISEFVKDGVIHALADKVGIRTNTRK